MKNKQFTVGKNNIFYIGLNFQEWFGSMEVKLPKKVDFTITKLPQSMNDKEIFEEIKPNKCSLGDVLFALKNNLIQKNWFGGIFYVKDVSGVLRTVFVHWSDVGWRVRAISVENPSRWRDGYQVFSRNIDYSSVLESSATSSDPLSSDAYKQGYEDGKKAERARIVSLI